MFRNVFYLFAISAIASASDVKYVSASASDIESDHSRALDSESISASASAVKYFRAGNLNAGKIPKGNSSPKRARGLKAGKSDEPAPIPVGVEVFLGTYQDLDFRPGELRVIKKLKGCTLLDYQLLEVHLGNPDNTIVRAFAAGERFAWFDFNSKDGPPEPQDVFVDGEGKPGNIVFKDNSGSVWTKQ